MQFAYQVYEMLDAAAQPVEFPDDQGVAFAQGFLLVAIPHKSLACFIVVF